MLLDRVKKHTMIISQEQIGKSPKGQPKIVDMEQRKLNNSYNNTCRKMCEMLLNVSLNERQ